jgi:hypothetical protein
MNLFIITFSFKVFITVENTFILCKRTKKEGHELI